MLQIFKIRAQTKEAKLQVALAELPYFKYVNTNILKIFFLEEEEGSLLFCVIFPKSNKRCLKVCSHTDPGEILLQVTSTWTAQRNFGPTKRHFWCSQGHGRNLARNQT